MCFEYGRTVKKLCADCAAFATWFFPAQVCIFFVLHKRCFPVLTLHSLSRKTESAMQSANLLHGTFCNLFWLLILLLLSFVLYFVQAFVLSFVRAFVLTFALSFVLYFALAFMLSSMLPYDLLRICPAFSFISSPLSARLPHVWFLCGSRRESNP